MSKLAEFLDRYETIIFDMDGVITKEEHYWNTAALTIWEFLFSHLYYGNETIDVKKMMTDYPHIRKMIFSNDLLITILKKKGINSNWDLSYITFALLILNERNYDKVLKAAEKLDDNILNAYPVIAKQLSHKLSNIDCQRNGELWQSMKACFQEWFLGEKLFFKVYNKKSHQSGKSGLCYSEKPLIDGDLLKEIFRLLHNNGMRLCIATGRPLTEMETPLESFGIMQYLDKNALICYDYVKAAENKTSKNLTKPHPYMFIKALFGSDFPDERLVLGDYPKDNIKKVLAVGDAGADILSAHSAGMDFCAVLTGISGQAAREYFENKKAEYILDSLEQFLQ